MRPKGNIIVNKITNFTKWPDDYHRNLFEGKRAMVIDIAVNNSSYLAVDENGTAMWDIDKRDVQMFIDSDVFDNDPLNPFTQMLKHAMGEDKEKSKEKSPEELVSFMSPEQTEKQGQSAFVANETLPIDGIGKVREDLEALGFVITDEVDRDVFYRVKFPDGWKKVPTDHPMWSNLVDPDGNERCSIFFKASFHDFNSHISEMNKRYRIKYDYPEDTKVDGFNQWIRVYDTKTDEILFEKPGGRFDTYAHRSDELEKECRQFLKKNFPKWEDPKAYWNEDVKESKKESEGIIKRIKGAIDKIIK